VPTLREHLNRAVEIHVREHLSSRLDRGDKLRVKLGLDPTAPDLHVGHLVVLDVLRAFQDEGHTVVLIVGDFTAMIGDPSGRSETRPILTREQVDAAARTYLDQLHLVLSRERLELRRNSEWLGEMKGADVLRLLGKATLQQVLQREDFANRIKAGNPIGAHEILYPFNQAYDSVAIRADVEIGGTDQLFNLLFGREIQKAYDQEPQDIAVFPLLEGTDGVVKMGNYIALTDPPPEIYGKVMSTPDSAIKSYARLINKDVQDLPGKNNRDNKAFIARSLVERLHGEQAAAEAEADFDRRFRRRELPEDMAVRTVSNPGDLVATLIEVGFAKSRGEARRLIDQGGVRVNGEKAAPETSLRDGDVLQAGKRNFVRIRLR
jgi:tyrosyl-tRNA synthetase